MQNSGGVWERSGMGQKTLPVFVIFLKDLRGACVIKKNDKVHVIPLGKKKDKNHNLMRKIRKTFLPPCY